MRLRTALVFMALLAAASSATPLAQEGHPLVGSWHGNWGFDATTRRDLTLVIDYTADGSDVSGVANPGYDTAPLQNLQLAFPKPTEWTASFVVELKDRSGATTRYTAVGKLEKLGSDRRTLIGTWTAGAMKGDFTMTRDRDYSR